MPETRRKQAKMGRPRLIARPVRVQIVLPGASVSRLNREREKTGESLSAIARRILEGNLP